MQTLVKWLGIYPMTIAISIAALPFVFVIWMVVELNKWVEFFKYRIDKWVS